MSSNPDDAPKEPKKRGVTQLTLGWLADRLRHAEKIKNEIKEGKYRVDSQAIAQAIVGSEKK